jgi:hypothetical protein
VEWQGAVVLVVVLLRLRKSQFDKPIAGTQLQQKN